MASIALLPPPTHAPGKDVAKFLARGLYTIKSEAVNYNDTSPVSVFVLPANTFLHSLVVEVSTAWDGAIPSMSLGVSGAATRHGLTSDMDLKTAGFYPIFKPYNYTADATLIATLVASTATQGIAYIWATFRPFSSKG